MTDFPTSSSPGDIDSMKSPNQIKVRVADTGIKRSAPFHRPRNTELPESPMMPPITSIIHLVPPCIRRKNLVRAATAVRARAYPARTDQTQCLRSDFFGVGYFTTPRHGFARARSSWRVSRPRLRTRSGCSRIRAFSGKVESGFPSENATTQKC
jgi:hypothetical protein